MSLTASGGNVLSVAFSHDSILLAVGAWKGTVVVWDVTSKTSVCDHSSHEAAVNALAFSSRADNRLIASGSRGGDICVFEIATKCAVRIIDHPGGVVEELVFSQDEAYIVSLYESNDVYIWDIGTGDYIYRVGLDSDTWIDSYNLSEDGTGIEVRREDGESLTVRLWDRDSQSWPVYRVSKDGWLYAKGPGCTTRLCWLPTEWRNVISIRNGLCCSLDYIRLRAVLLDVSHLPEYVESFGHRSG